VLIVEEVVDAIADQSGSEHVSLVGRLSPERTHGETP
jgi:hypothetical protein